MAYDPDTAFTDEAAESLQALNRFLLAALTKDEPPLNDLKDQIEMTLGAMNDPGSSFFGIIDAADESLRDDHIFPEDVERIMDDLMDDLGSAEPLYRVKHSPSDGWTAIERLTGDGLVQPIAYLASPTLAEEIIPFIESRSGSH